MAVLRIRINFHIPVLAIIILNIGYQFMNLSLGVKNYQYLFKNPVGQIRAYNQKLKCETDAFI